MVHKLDKSNKVNKIIKLDFMKHADDKNYLNKNQVNEGDFSSSLNLC